MNDDYTPENLDREILEWYSKIDTSKLGEALNALCKNYFPSKENSSCRILSRLHELSSFDCGLWVAWKTDSGRTSLGGFVCSLMENSPTCCARNSQVDGFFRVPYSDIIEVDLQLPSHKKKSKKKWEEAIAQVLNIQHETIRLIDSVLETVSGVADKSFGKDEFDMSSHQVYSKMYDLAKSIEQVREQLKENSPHE